MGLKEDIMAVKKEVNEVKEQSFSMELLRTQAENNAQKDKRNFIVIMTLIILLFAETIYMFKTLNDIGVTEETTTVEQTNDNGNNNYIGNDGDINNGKAEDNKN